MEMNDDNVEDKGIDDEAVCTRQMMAEALRVVQLVSREWEPSVTLSALCSFELE